MKINKKPLIIAGSIAAGIIIIIVVIGLIFSAHKNNKYDGFYKTAQSAYIAGDYITAVSNLEDAIDIKPTEECYKLLADIYMSQGELDMAINVLYIGCSKTGSESLSAYLETLKAQKTSETASNGSTVLIGGNEVETSAVSLVQNNLSLSNADISSLASLENLESLSISGNAISDLSPLASLSKLTFLQLSDNNITDISALKNLTGLRTCYLDGNPIEDFSPLYGLASLTTLSIQNIDIPQSQLEELQKKLPSCKIYASATEEEIVEISIGGKTFMSDVTDLDLGKLDIKDISKLSKCKQLKTLDLRDNKISDITPLMELQELEWLSLWNNSVSDIRPLMSLVNLKYLDIDSNKITDITTLRYLPNLEQAWLNYNDIKSISPLLGLKYLERLGLKGTGITDKDLKSLESMKTLVELAIEDNEGLTQKQFKALQSALSSCIITHSDLISTIKFGSKEFESDATEISATSLDIDSLSGLETFTNLKILTLSSNNISDLSPLAELTSLQAVDLNSNKIEVISAFKNLTSMRSLSLVNNKITDISALANLTSLTELHLSMNKINDIADLSALTSLIELNIDSNNIDDIKALSGMTSLVSLGLDSNDIEDLSPLYHLTNLRTVYIRGNSSISRQDVLELKEMLPDCVVVSDY